jgi:hypothetical protein
MCQLEVLSLCVPFFCLLISVSSREYEGWPPGHGVGCDCSHGMSR